MKNKAKTGFKRRIELIFYIMKHQGITTIEIAKKFSVCRTTIYSDVNFLSSYVPIYTRRGKRGGLFILEGYKQELFMYLSKDEEQLLKILLIERTDEKERFLLKSIINHYAMPTFERQKCF